MIYNSQARPRIKPANQTYDFGLLKSRGKKITQSEAVLVSKDKNLSNFATMDHEKLIRIIRRGTLQEKRALSRWFFENNGIYARAVRYISDIMKYDFLIYPNLDLESEFKDSENKKILKKFNEVLGYFDASSIQLLCRNWANIIALEGVYYGYVADDINDKLVIQDLPVDFCRSRFLHRGLPVVEFNMSYFDKITNNDADREKILSLFPDEFQKGYRLYKSQKLQPESQGDAAGWTILDLNRAFKFNFFGSNNPQTPPFLSAIPPLIELDEVEDLEKEKLLQEIQKILVQEFSLDSKGQLPFNMNELAQLNQNAVDMVGNAVGVSVLTTVAKVHVDDLQGTSTENSETAVSEATDSVYDALGLSSNLFNTEGSIALEKSITVDEAFAKVLLLEFEQFFNNYLDWKFNKPKLKFRLKMLYTSIFNYKDLSKAYENLTKIGFSRFLPMVALGHTQKEIVSTAKLEQQIMQLDTYMLPPFSSNTMSSGTWSDVKAQQAKIFEGAEAKTDLAKQVEKTIDSQSESTGRPELPDDQKSDKTLLNQESQG